jgi:hypothetical protein
MLTQHRSLALAVTLLCLQVLSGCSKSPPPTEELTKAIHSAAARGLELHGPGAKCSIALTGVSIDKVGKYTHFMNARSGAEMPSGYWPVRARLVGRMTCYGTLPGEPLDRLIEFRIFRNSFGEWQASLDPFAN